MILTVASGAFRFKHITFEWHDYLGPGFLRMKDHELKPQQLRPARDYAALSKWQKLSGDERESYRL